MKNVIKKILLHRNNNFISWFIIITKCFRYIELLLSSKNKKDSNEDKNNTNNKDDEKDDDIISNEDENVRFWFSFIIFLTYYRNTITIKTFFLIWNF